jgi:hypothetical protein
VARVEQPRGYGQSNLRKLYRRGDLCAATITGADAIHAGSDFLAEDSDLWKRVESRCRPSMEFDRR